MKITTSSVLKFKDRYVKKLDPETLDKVTYSIITNLSKYKKAIEISETERTEDEKKIAYYLIDQAIYDMDTTKEPILVDNLLFAIAYPESYKLVRQYYDTLTETCLNSNKFMKFDGEKFSPFNNKDKNYVISRIKQIEQSTYTLFMPLFENDDFLEKEGKFDRRAIENIRSKNRILRIGENESLVNQKTAYEIYDLLLNSNYTLDKICKEYQATSDSIHNLLKSNLSEKEYRAVLEALKRNTLKKYYEINHVIDLLYDYIPNGISLENGTNMPFTMLDYYSITYLNPSTILEEMNKRAPKSKEEAVARAICKKYLYSHKNQGPFINKEMLLQSKTTIIRGNDEFNISDYADEIYDTFRANNIPLYNGLTNTAFTRLTRNQPIFPLIQKKETMEHSI